MGNKGTKLDKKLRLSKKDLKFLMKQTNRTEDEIKQIHEEFMRNNPDGTLNKQEFVRLYSQLKTEPEDTLNEIAENIFQAFDPDNNGTINFNEFMVAYALTSRGDNYTKLDYAFEIYDKDENGSLDRNEIRTVLFSMLDMLGASKVHTNVGDLVNECIGELDYSGDGRISKDEFIQGLLKNYSLRSLMSPFN